MGISWMTILCTDSSSEQLISQKVARRSLPANLLHFDESC
jgi:hypothetical protein